MLIIKIFGKKNMLLTKQDNTYTGTEQPFLNTLWDKQYHSGFHLRSTAIPIKKTHIF